MNLSNAIKAREAKDLPSTSEQYRALEREIAKSRPAAASAKRRSESLNAEAAGLRRQMAEETAHMQALEEQKGRIDAELARLVPEEQSMAKAFEDQRAELGRLLAVLERLQSDMPPATVLRADDVLAAARGEMVLGLSLPRIYEAAAALSRRLEALHDKRVELSARRKEGARVAVQLAAARSELDQLLAIKSQEADQASAQYGDLEARLEAAASRAADLEALLARVARLRLKPVGQGIVVVTAASAKNPDVLRPGSLASPVAGSAVAGGFEGVGGDRAPGLTFYAPAGARVLSPADGEVLFAGAYHKSGKVLILEMSGGYDLVLAGLETVDVRPGDQLLAGEPVGAMAQTGTEKRLYFELRQNGKGVNPAPWMQVDPRKAKRS